MNPGENKKEKVQVQALFQSKLQSPKITISCKYEFVDKGGTAMKPMKKLTALALACALFHTELRTLWTTAGQVLSALRGHFRKEERHGR